MDDSTDSSVNHASATGTLEITGTATAKVHFKITIPDVSANLLAFWLEYEFVEVDNPANDPLGLRGYDDLQTEHLSIVVKRGARFLGFQFENHYAPIRFQCVERTPFVVQYVVKILSPALAPDAARLWLPMGSLSLVQFHSATVDVYWSHFRDEFNVALKTWLHERFGVLEVAIPVRSEDVPANPIRRLPSTPPVPGTDRFDKDDVFDWWYRGGKSLYKSLAELAVPLSVAKGTVYNWHSAYLDVNGSSPLPDHRSHFTGHAYISEENSSKE